MLRLNLSVHIQTQTNYFVYLAPAVVLLEARESGRLTLMLLVTDSQVDGSPVHTCHTRR
jgi:hypothetical protein